MAGCVSRPTLCPHNPPLPSPPLPPAGFTGRAELDGRGKKPRHNPRAPAGGEAVKAGRASYQGTTATPGIVPKVKASGKLKRLLPKVELHQNCAVFFALERFPVIFRSCRTLARSAAAENRAPRGFAAWLCPNSHLLLL